MLNAHSEVIAPPECGFLQWWFKKYKSKISSGQTEYVDDFIKDLQKSKKIETWNLNYNLLREDIVKCKPSSFGGLGAQVYLAYALQKNKKVTVIVDKNNYYVYHLSELKEIWNDAKYIFMVRDGRDVACSYKALKNLDSNSSYKPRLPVDIDGIAMEWNNINTGILLFLNSLPKDKYIFVRYEDLLLNTEGELTRIMDFLNLNFEAAMTLYFQQNQSNQEEPLSTLDWKRKTLEKPDINNIGKYKKLLSNDEVQIFNKLNEKLLLKFGYRL